MSMPSEHPGQVPADLTGMGQAANGLIRAVVGADGRVSALSLAPELRRLGPRGPDPKIKPGTGERDHRLGLLMSLSRCGEAALRRRVRW